MRRLRLVYPVSMSLFASLRPPLGDRTRLVYLQEFPSYTMLKSMRKSTNRYFHVPQPTFLFPLETPLRLSRNMLHRWKDNAMLAKRLAACTYLSEIVSELYDA